MQLAFFGGIYNNHLALAAAIADARGRGVDRMYCLGDLGAFGPHPDRVFPLLMENDVICIQGNYDHSIGNELNDCQCGYTDPRDNLFAQISYDYTFQKTSPANGAWMRELPAELRFEVDGLRFLLCHGSPRRTNEFLWESTTSTAFLNKLTDDHEADVILGTHTGIHWQRNLSCDRRFINVGCLGRPENDGTTDVWYTIVRTDQSSVQCPVTSVPRQPSAVSRQPSAITVEFIPLAYDHHRLAREMQDEKLPDEFVETILTGWWTTCLEVLPAKDAPTGEVLNMPHDLPIDLGDLTLRRLRHTDFADVLSYYSDPGVARYCEWAPMSAEQVATLMEGQGSVRPGDPDVPLLLAVELKAEDRVIGDCSLTITSKPDRQAEIGYCFHPAYHRLGYAVRAVRSVLDYAFASLELHRIIARVDVRNERSWRLLERIGMRREGHFRQCGFVKGEWIDDYLYAMLAGERGTAVPDASMNRKISI